MNDVAETFSNELTKAKNSSLIDGNLHYALNLCCIRIRVWVFHNCRNEQMQKVSTFWHKQKLSPNLLNDVRILGVQTDNFIRIYPFFLNSLQKLHLRRNVHCSIPSISITRAQWTMNLGQSNTKPVYKVFNKSMCKIDRESLTRIMHFVSISCDLRPAFCVDMQYSMEFIAK